MAPSVKEFGFQEAVPILEEVVKREPHALTAYLLLGRAYVSLKEYQKAIPPLQHVVETMPDNSLAHYELGCALVKTGRWNDAAPEFSRQPPIGAYVHQTTESRGGH